MFIPDVARSGALCVSVQVGCTLTCKFCHTGTQTMVRNLEQATGKTLDQWVAVVKKLGAQKHGEIVRTLKEKHRLTHGYANLVAHNALQSDASFSDADSLVEAQYAGAKAALRPLYDTVISEVQQFFVYCQSTIAVDYDGANIIGSGASAEAGQI